MKSRIWLMFVLLIALSLTGCATAASASSNSLSADSPETFIAINDGTVTVCGLSVEVTLPRNNANEVIKNENGSLDVTLKVGDNKPRTINPGQGAEIEKVKFFNFTHSPSFDIKVDCP